MVIMGIIIGITVGKDCTYTLLLSDNQIIVANDEEKGGF